MTRRTVALHETFMAVLGDQILEHGDITNKPLEVDFALPMPPRLRLYMYSLVVGGPSRPNEFKAVLRAPGQVVGEYASFDHSGDRLAIVVGYRADLDVFVLWDASLHPRFKHGGNIQVHRRIVEEAAVDGWSVQRRPLTTGVTEVVIACQSRNLARAIRERVAWTGGVLRP